MLFKNLTMYRIIDEKLDSLYFISDRFKKVLLENIFKDEIGPHEVSKIGWCPPVTHEITQEINQCVFFRLRKDEKVLPPGAVNKAVNDHVRKIEMSEGRKLNKRERSQIKDEVIYNLLPTALVQSRYVNVYIDTAHDRLFIDTTSGSVADELTGFLRQCIGSLPIRFIETMDSPQSVLTNLVKAEQDLQVDNEYGDLKVGEECTMDGEEKEKISIKNMELSDPDIIEHLNAGMTVSSLRMIFMDQFSDDLLSFTVTKDLQLKRLKWESAFQSKIIDQEDEEFSDTPAVSYWNTEMFVMTSEIRTLLDQLFEVFGGEDDLL